jgi:dTDP-glucose pyrophosphorylase
MKIDGSLPAEQWRGCLLPETASVQEAIACLDRSGLQIVMIVDAGGVLVGTLTDGDIRRGLIRGVLLSNPVHEVMHRDPLVAPPQWGHDMVLQLMVANKIRQLPVVDAARRVVGLHVWDEFLVPETRSNPIVVMAGGKGTRLRPFTENCPKPMLPVAGKPMLERVIERAKLEGFEHFVIAIHYLGHMIEEYFGDGSRWNVKIEYLRENSPLGTAGALGLFESRPSVPFIVTNGDLVTDFRYSELLEFHLYHQAVATMAVRIYETQNPFGVVRTEGVDIVGFEEKPVSRCHINAGMYVIDPQALDLIGRNEPCDMPELFMRLRERSEKTIAFPMHEAWLDVGRPNDLEKARNGALPAE